MPFSQHFITAFSLFTLFSSCRGQTPQPTATSASPMQTTIPGDTVTELGNEIDGIFHDSKNNYWFATNGNGVYYYNGRTLLHITDKHGLCSNFVLGVQEDVHGKIWFSTRDGICRLDIASFYNFINTSSFTNFTDTIKQAKYGKLNYVKGGLFFNHLQGICFYDGKTFTNFTIYPETYTPPAYNYYRPYAVYSIMADSAGQIWVGTQEKGVCRYDGNTITYITGHDLEGPAVRSLFQDKAGNYWFGNNGGGLYHYNGSVLRNITEEKKLGNDAFLREKMPVDKPESIARVFAINQDRDGTIWIGTPDAGVWKYDGENLTQYTMADGLSGMSVTVIYKDRNGELWFVANGEQVCKFDGKRFNRVVLR